MGVEIAFVLPLDGGAGGELDGVIVLAVIFCLTFLQTFVRRGFKCEKHCGTHLETGLSLILMDFRGFRSSVGKEVWCGVVERWP